MIIYLTISCITLCFCVITYLWVRHKRESKKWEYKTVEEVARAELVVDLQESQKLWYLNTNRVLLGGSGGGPIPFESIRKDKEDFLPKKRMKVHKIDQGIRKETFVSPRLSYGKWRDRQ